MTEDTGSGAVPELVGMVHLPALPGTPGFDGDRATLRERAVADAEALVAGGMDAVLVENFGDVPFHPGEVPRHVVASMTALVGAVRRAVDVPVGVNVLRSDGPAAIAVAAATGGRFVRVNVHTGARVTDQGVVEGRAHETLRLRDRLDATDVRVLADVDVKHSAPLADRPLAEVARETVERGGADGLVVSGPATGTGADRDRLERVAAVAHETGVPLVVGSGTTPETVAELLEVADSAIVGTALKAGSEVTAPVDRERVERLVAAARDG
ncbi:BtpA/SgcQ family protein [Haloglomus halophilum]|uniref:BtpA/SgcQ family protein n=1 Tax=Haloglomus halophilum TaxID=2962672 RepID=UPI0020C9581C|nr:BtpA/SgcQ family protein [Haloglomus halophilum]